MVCPHGQERKGWASANILTDKEEGVNFSWFCADVLYERPLKSQTNDQTN